MLGKDNPELAQLLAERAATELRAGNLELATDLLDRALALSEAGNGPDHPQTAGFLRWRGSVDPARGDTAKARERLERAVEILDRRHGDVQELAHGRFDLARCLPPEQALAHGGWPSRPASASRPTASPTSAPRSPRGSRGTAGDRPPATRHGGLGPRCG